jgi:alanine dehydrogenase
MTLHLREEDVESLLTMDDAMESVERSMREQGLGDAECLPRQVIDIGSVRLSVLPAGMRSLGVVGFKTYTVGLNDALRFWVLLFDRHGELTCLLEAEHLSMVRTGAACGVATKYLSRPDSKTVGIVGTGYNAPAQLEAVCGVRSIEKVVAYSRTRPNLLEFCSAMTRHLGLPVEPASTAEDVVRVADILITITSSATPVVQGEWLHAGMHLNLAGAMKANRREIDTGALLAADLIVVDDLRQSREESGEMIQASREGVFDWSGVRLLSDIVTGNPPPRSSESITLFKNHGVGIWDIAVAAKVYELAKSRKLGREVALEHPATPLYKGSSDFVKSLAGQLLTRSDKEA